MSLLNLICVHVVGVLDVSFPLAFDVGIVSGGPLGEAMDLFSGFQPIVSISSGDLFSPTPPSFGIDLDIEVLVKDGENIISTLLNDLTGGLGSIAGDSSGLSAGPLGNIEGILDKFDLDFTDLFDEFKGFYDDFKADILSGDSDLLALNSLKPFKSFSQFPSLLQLGSKNPSEQFSPDLKGLLWDKLSVEFANPTYNGVSVPSLPLGKSFLEAYPTRGDFPGKQT